MRILPRASIRSRMSHKSNAPTFIVILPLTLPKYHVQHVTDSKPFWFLSSDTDGDTERLTVKHFEVKKPTHVYFFRVRLSERVAATTDGA
jgi:hypothetical protein